MTLIVKSSKNKGNNRRSLDIVRDMLSVASVKVRKTRLMYQANLSFVQAEKYLHHLLDSGLVVQDVDSFYLVTRKGLDFLKLYDKHVERCKLINEQVEESVKDRFLLEQMCSGSEADCRRRASREISLPAAGRD